MRTVALSLTTFVALILPANASQSVAITDFSFTPTTVTIEQSASVVWTYAVGAGTAPHTVTASNGSFDSGTLAPGATYERAFPTAGTFGYYCRFHGSADGTGMAGSITVRTIASQTPAPTSEHTPPPRKTLAATPAGSQSPTTSPYPSPSASPASTPPQSDAAFVTPTQTSNALAAKAPGSTSRLLPVSLAAALAAATFVVLTRVKPRQRRR